MLVDMPAQKASAKKTKVLRRSVWSEVQAYRFTVAAKAKRRERAALQVRRTFSFVALRNQIPRLARFAPEQLVRGGVTHKFFLCSIPG